MIATHWLADSTSARCSTGSGLEWPGSCFENSATMMSREGSIPSLPATYAGEARLEEEFESPDRRQTTESKANG